MKVGVIIRTADDPRARLLMLEQWRAGLRVSEALALEVSDLSLESHSPTLRVRSGKGKGTEGGPGPPGAGICLQDGAFVRECGREQTDRRSEGDGVEVGTNRGEAGGGTRSDIARQESRHPQLRHSCARHLLVHGIPINYLSRWLGHSAIQTTLIYLELVPDPTGSLASVP